MGPAFGTASGFSLAIPSGIAGEAIAFCAETAMAAALMLMVLIATNHATLYRWAGVAYGLWVAVYVLCASPLSGFGTNPARTIAVNLLDGTWNGVWPALLAPILGMQLSIDAYRLLTGRTQVLCAKLAHNVEGRCIFKCQHPDQARAIALKAFRQGRHQR
jgi:aquaporin Z